MDSPASCRVRSTRPSGSGIGLWKARDQDITKMARAFWAIPVLQKTPSAPPTQLLQHPLDLSNDRPDAFSWLMTSRVLFLCTGNYCRSRYAEENFEGHVARLVLERRALEWPGIESGNACWRVFFRGLDGSGQP